MSQTNFVLMLMYDMPVITTADKKAYRKLTNYLQKSGFYALQDSIYIKPLSEKQKAKRYLSEIKQLAAIGSHIRALMLTHQSFIAMEAVIGQDTWGETLIKKPNGVISF